MDGATPKLVVLGFISMQAEPVKWSKPVSSTLHGLCISSCLQVPDRPPHEDKSCTQVTSLTLPILIGRVKAELMTAQWKGKVGLEV